MRRKISSLLFTLLALICVACDNPGDRGELNSARVPEPSKVTSELTARFESESTEKSVVDSEEAVEESSEEPTDEPMVEEQPTEEVVIKPIDGMSEMFYMEEAWIDYAYSDYYNPDVVLTRDMNHRDFYVFDGEDVKYCYYIVYSADTCRICLTDVLTNDLIKEFSSNSKHYIEEGIPDYSSGDLVCLYDPVPDIEPYDYASSMLDEGQIQYIKDGFALWSKMQSGIVTDNDVNTALENIGHNVGYSWYEILWYTDPMPDYPFRIIVLQYDSAVTYVVTENAMDGGCVFIKVPSTEENVNYLDYAYHVGD